MSRTRWIWAISRPVRRKLPLVMRVIAATASPVVKSAVSSEAEFGPVAGQDERQFVGGQRPVVVDEPDPAVELGVAGEAFFEAGHADQDQADAGPVVVVAELFQRRGLEPVGLVDDQQFGAAARRLLRQRGLKSFGVWSSQLDAPAQPVMQEGDLLIDDARGGVDLGRVDDRAVRHRLLRHGHGP